MNSIEDLIQLAQELQDKGQIEPALETFSKAFDLMIDAAGKYALSKKADVTDMAVLRTMTQELFAYSTEYLKQDSTASYILNAMGVLFGEMKEYENAEQKFLESIKYIPEGQEYNDPVDNLEHIASEAAAARAAALEEQEDSSDSEIQ